MVGPGPNKPVSGVTGLRVPREGVGRVCALKKGSVGTDAISVSPRSPSHGLPDGGRIPDVYAAFIPESEGSPTPSVEDIRGAAAVGEGRRERLEEPVQGFLTYAFVPTNPGGTAPGLKSNVTILASPLNFI